MSLKRTRDGSHDAPSSISRKRSKGSPNETGVLPESDPVEWAMPLAPVQILTTIEASENHEISRSDMPASISLAQTVESTLGKYFEELSQDTEHWTRAWMRRARYRIKAGPPVVSTTKAPYSFAALKPIQVPRNLKEASTDNNHGLFTHDRAKQKAAFSVPINTFTTHDVMPEYSHYVDVESNFLAPNEPTMRCWPYFHDDFDMETMADNLKSQYHIDIAQRPRKLVRLLQGQQYDSYVQSAIHDLDLEWSDLLSFLLQPHVNIGNDPDARRANAARSTFCSEDFPSRTTTESVTTLSSLPLTSTDRLATAACLFEGFQRLARFSLWHVVRRHISDYLSADVDAATGGLDAMEQMTCKLCLRFDCPYHGELRQYEDSDFAEDAHNHSEEDSAVEGDIINPPKRNYRTRVAFPSRGVVLNDPSSGIAAKAARRNGGMAQNQYIWEPDKRKPFYPCHHPGSSCEDARCSCYLQRIQCEKICGCQETCARRWRGCKCHHEKTVSGARTLCFADDRCACYKHSRECDADLCRGCRAVEVLDPFKRYDPDILRGRCRNVSIQRGAPKHTLLGQSNIHGFGLYAGEDIKAHDFVGEYKGEIVTAQEAERRGAVYEHQKLSYLFMLNASQEIDSTYYGNRIRFINHAREGHANLYPRIVLVNAVHRIALYGSRAIPKGNELFFDYGPKFPAEQLSGNAATNPTPRARNAKIVEEFHDVVVTMDDRGKPRAHKAVAGRAEPRSNGLKAPARAERRVRSRHRSDSERASVPHSSPKHNVTSSTKASAPLGLGSIEDNFAFAVDDGDGSEFELGDSASSDPDDLPYNTSKRAFPSWTRNKDVSSVEKTRLPNRKRQCKEIRV